MHFKKNHGLGSGPKAQRFFTSKAILVGIAIHIQIKPGGNICYHLEIFKILKS